MRVVVFIGLLLQVTIGSASPMIGDYELSLTQGAELVDERFESEVVSHEVVLGSLEMINRQLTPEDSTWVRGTRIGYTYFLPDARDTQVVMDDILTQLSELGELAFQCEGRGCGSSNYWANRIFDQAILYGPVRYQRYTAVKLNDDTGYVVVYVGMRATRKIYVKIQHVDTQSSQRIPNL
ncbi:MAG: DUF4892 domain-containing protein [Pseudomonadota bacterium]